MWQGTACDAGMRREMHLVAENVVEVVIFSGLSENFQIKIYRSLVIRSYFWQNLFPLQRVERMQPLKSQMIKSHIGFKT